MDKMSWVTSWHSWRTVMGPKGSRQRRNVEAYLTAHPAVLYWGDSWFSTPLYINLARHSASRIDGIGMLIGKPGAEAAELFNEKNVDRTVARISASPFDMICLSAGGNDCLDERLAKVFAAWQNNPGKTKIDALTAYAKLEADGAFQDILEAYERLLLRLQEVKQKRPQLKVVGHPYVPIERIGQKADLTVANIGLIAWIKDDVGPWLWNRMAPVLENKDEAKQFAHKMLVEGFSHKVLNTLATRHPTLFSAVDFSSVTAHTQPSFWNDEIHPTEAGFGQLVRPFNAHMKKQLPATKQAAVH